MPLMSKASSPKGNSLLSTRRGTIAVAAAVALLAGAILIAFLNQYRDNVAADGEAAKVLVANGLIAKGAPGDVVAAEDSFRMSSVRKDQLEAGAITDPADLRGKAAVRDVLPGQQLTSADFVPARNGAQGRLGASHRALAVPVDAVHGLTGLVAVGDRVDVFAGFSAESGGTARPILKTLLQNALVLRAPGGAEGGGGNNIVLRVPNEMVGKVAYAADHGRLWIIMRPAAGANELRPETVTLESVLSGTRSIPRNRGGGR